MAQLFVTYWRDIPSQVTVKQGRKSVKAMMSDRFQVAIDEATMRSGMAESNDYLEQWRRGSPVEVKGDFDAVVADNVARLEAEFDPKTLKEMIKTGGVAA